MASLRTPKAGLILDQDVDVAVRDGVGAASYTRYSADYNTGSNTIHTGGNTASYILLPVIPPKSWRK